MAMRAKTTLSLDDAQILAAACLQAARSHEASVCIVVVDEAGGLLTAVRMDGARQYTVELAAKKARTAAGIGVSTAIIEQLYRNRPMQSPEFVSLRGGIPILHDGACAGAIGISGATPEIDDLIANEASSALG
jgi:glc operon protein GlcG